MAVNTYRRKQKDRDRAAERQNRRWKQNQRQSRSIPLPDDLRGHLLLKGLARPVDSVRGQLLEVILSGAIQSRDGWVYDGSIRDLAYGGLPDGKIRNECYLLNCMRDFVEKGILEKQQARKGKPVVYRIRTP